LHFGGKNGFDSKEKDFCRAKMQGKSNKESAVLAGYSERSAGAKGSQLADDPDVIAYLASLNSQGAGVGCYAFR
jgi:phage terminase small subunit